MLSLGENWRLVYTNDMTLPVTNRTRQIAKHYLLYPTRDVTLAEYHAEANCQGDCAWVPCQFAGGAGEDDGDDFEPDERDGEGITDVCVHRLFKMIYDDLVNDSPAFDATLLVGLYCWLADAKPGLGQLAEDRGLAAVLMSYLVTIADGRVYWARSIISAIEAATGWVRMARTVTLRIY